MSGEPWRSWGRGLVNRRLVESPPPPPPAVLLLAVPGRLFCFGSLVVLGVECQCFSLFVLYINIQIGKNRC